VSTPSSISIGNDLAASEACVAMGPSNHKLLARVDDIPGVHKQLIWDGDLDDMVEDVLPDLLVGDVGIVLGGDQNSVHSFGFNQMPLFFVLNGDLHFAIRSDPAQNLLPSTLFKSSDQCRR